MKRESKPIPSGEVLRANTAVALVLIAVLAVALVAVLAGLRAARNQARAEEAEAAGKERLWNAYLEEARAMRTATDAGHRQAALNVISNAVAIRASSELRSAAIATLALSDISQAGDLFPIPPDLQAADMDQKLDYFGFGRADGSVVICSAQTGSNLFTFRPKIPDGETLPAVEDINFSPDGRTLAARYAAHRVALWNLENQTPVTSSGGSNQSGFLFGSESGISFSADSQKIIFSDEDTKGQISILDLASGQKTRSGPVAGPHFFRLSPDMKRVAIVSDTSVQLMDFPSGANVQALRHNSRVVIMAWSPDGRLLAVSCEDGDIYMWDTASGTSRLLPGHNERCANMGFSPDGTHLFSSSPAGTTLVWDVSLGRVIAAGEGIACSFSSDGLGLGFWRPWSVFGTWRVVPSPYYAIHACAKSEGPVFTVDLSPSGRWCVAMQNYGFRIWDLQSNDKEYYAPERDVYCVRVSPDEKSLFVCRKTGLEVWALATNAAGELDLRREVASQVALPDGLGSRAIALSLDGKTAVVELTDKRMMTIDLIGKQPPVFFKERWGTVNFKGPGSPTGTGRFVVSPDGRWMVTGYDFGKGNVPRVWDARSGDLVTTLDAKSSLAAFSPDGHWLGIAGSDRYSIWSVGDWKLARDFSRDEPSVVHGTMAFSKGGDFFADSPKRQMAQLCDWNSAGKIADLISPLPQSINNIRMALDGSVLVTATANDMIEVWRLGALRQQLAKMGLDWDQASAGRPVSIAATAPSSSGLRATLALSLAGVLLAGVFAVLTLRQHRTSIARFISAEAKTAKQNRELEMAKIELMHSQKMQALGTLAAGIAHDFNNLLSVIRMSNQLIARTVKDNAEIKEYTTDIEKASVQGKTVVRSMLGYARDESVTDQPMDVNEVVENTVSLLNKEFLRGIQLTLELSPETQPVAIHQGRLEQILLNLIVNASEAMGGRGKLKITSHLRSSAWEREVILRPRASENYVELAVSDSGPGIPQEIMGRIFEPFFSTKRSASTPGTGLGLSLVYSIAQQDGLGLSVESPPGAGASFTILIPVAGNETPPVR